MMGRFQIVEAMPSVDDEGTPSGYNVLIEDGFLWVHARQTHVDLMALYQLAMAESLFAFTDAADDHYLHARR